MSSFSTYLIGFIVSGILYWFLEGSAGSTAVPIEG